jgi:hypothetical protein
LNCFEIDAETATRLQTRMMSTRIETTFRIRSLPFLLSDEAVPQDEPLPPAYEKKATGRLSVVREGHVEALCRDCAVCVKA